MDTKRIVVTGGPGSGKTALIKYLEKNGHAVMHEISREVTLQAQKEGIEQLFLTNPILFSKKLLEGRLEQFQNAQDAVRTILFYDRGLPDVTAYMDYVGTHYPDSFAETCNQYRYDAVFLLPPWELIYEQDNERYESFDQAEKIYHYLKNAYVSYGYIPHEVPIGSVEDRVAHILKSLKNLY